MQRLGKIGRKSFCFAIMIVHPPGDDFCISPPPLDTVAVQVQRCETDSIGTGVRWLVVKFLVREGGNVTGIESRRRRSVLSRINFPGISGRNFPMSAQELQDKTRQDTGTLISCSEKQSRVNC